MLRASKNNIVNLKNVLHIDGPRVAYLIQRDNDGRIWVDYDGNPDGPLVAQLCASACDRLASLSDFTDIRVLVIFEDNQGDRPIIIDVLHNDLNEFEKETRLSTNNKPDITMMDAIIDGRQMKFCAKDQIVLQAGTASITLMRNGKVVIRGADVTTRSSGVNRIIGGSVKVN